MLPHVDIEKLLVQTMEGDVITSLLAGNDTCCFTTKQYLVARDNWIKKITGVTREELGLGPFTPYDFKIARAQLLSIGLVDELKPGLWTMKTSVITSSALTTER